MGALWVLLFLLLIYAVLAKFFGYLKGLGVFIGLFVLMIVYVNIGIRHECVVMPNGLLIGRATVFSQMVENQHGLPDIAIKYPDGRLLRRGDDSIDFYDAQSVGGDYPGSMKGRSNKFIYVNNVGLLVESREPGRFQYYWDKKKRYLSNVPPTTDDVIKSERSLQQRIEDSGTRLWPDDFKGFGGNLYLIYSLLYENPENRRKWCPTAWFSP